MPDLPDAVSARHPATSAVNDGIAIATAFALFGGLVAVILWATAVSLFDYRRKATP